MSACITPRDFDEVLDEVLDADAERVSITAIAATFGIAAPTVLAAIRDGRLPAKRANSATGRTIMWLIRPRDAALIWGHRLRRRETTTA